MLASFRALGHTALDTKPLLCLAWRMHIWDDNLSGHRTLPSCAGSHTYLGPTVPNRHFPQARTRHVGAVWPLKRSRRGIRCSKQTDKRRDKQTTKQTDSKETNERASKRTDTQTTNKQASGGTNTNTQTHKQTNKHTTNVIISLLTDTSVVSTSTRTCQTKHMVR